MNIYLDNIIFSLQNAGGISVLWYELIKRALEDNDLNPVFLHEANHNIFSKHLNIPSDKQLQNPYTLIPLKLQRYLNPNILKGKGIFHSSYYRTSKSHQLVNITTVHDFTYEYYRSGFAKSVHSWQKGLAIKNAHKIICVSMNTKKDLLKFYPETSPEKIKIIYNGVDEVYKILNSTNINQLEKLILFNPKEYVVFVGDRNSVHKNFKVAVESCKATNTPLVLVGGGSITEKEKEFFRQTGFSAYKHLNGITNEELNIIYNYALCLIYPSSYEGFGIPVIEAQKAGCPVISANNSSITEIAENSALLVEEIVSVNFADKIDLLKQNSRMVDQLVNKGIENSNRFSWDICYQQTKDLYKELYEEYF